MSSVNGPPLSDFKSGQPLSTSAGDHQCDVNLYLYARQQTFVGLTPVTLSYYETWVNYGDPNNSYYYDETNQEASFADMCRYPSGAVPWQIWSRNLALTLQN